MAKATVVRLKPKVKLTLTNAEAQFLYDLFGKSTGSNPHSESIYNALCDIQSEANLNDPDKICVNINASGTLYID